MLVGKTGRTTTPPIWQPKGCSQEVQLGAAEATASNVASQVTGPTNVQEEEHHHKGQAFPKKPQ